MTSGFTHFGDALTSETCRVALAALLHDLGKLTERGDIFDLKSQAGLANVQLYCPFHQEGNYHSHRHAAATALGLDEIEQFLPPVLHGEIAPFVPRGGGDVTDSFINAAASHHKPETFLQWCVAIADRVASGFEREKFEEYNRQKGGHVVEPLLVQFEAYGFPAAERKDDLKWRYPLAPLSVGALFPERPRRQADRPEAVAAYKALWKTLKDGLNQIPTAHRGNWPLWLDAFDTLWLTAAHAIPSASSFGVKADVSLYDHSRATAAFAAAIWRYHHERGDDPAQIAARQRSREDWDEKKFLLIQGDFAGIQNFIFGGSASTQKGAAKLLRGRSALVSILCELAALKVLDALSLPPTSQAINAAGKFLIVAPNTKACAERLKRVRAELDRWFLKASFGLASVALSAETASCNDFIGGGFAQLRQRLAGGLDRAKRQRFDLAADGGPDPLLAADFSNGVCPFDGRLPADCDYSGAKCAQLSADQIELGGWLARESKPFLHIERGDGGNGGRGALRSDFFGYRLVLSSQGDDARALRIFDLSLPGGDAKRMLFSGFARRAINAYAPVLKQDQAADKRYEGAEKIEIGHLKTFDHLARDAQSIDPDGRVIGVAALGALKGDVDNLGQIFATALGERPTFANWAALSRRVSAFFSLVVPHLCAAEPEFTDIYTVFAGGDDFYFIGPWRAIKAFAARLRASFRRYCAENDALHFSASYLMIKPGHPMRIVTDNIDAGLDDAKSHKQDGRIVKNAIHLGGLGGGTTMGWDRFASMEERRRMLGELAEKHELTTAYLYDVLHYCGMAEAAKKQVTEARWRALLYYRTRRHVEQALRPGNGCAGAIQTEIVEEIGGRGIDIFGTDYRHIVSDFLYARRD